MSDENPWKSGQPFYNYGGECRKLEITLDYPFGWQTDRYRYRSSLIFRHCGLVNIKIKHQNDTCNSHNLKCLNHQNNTCKNSNFKSFFFLLFIITNYIVWKMKTSLSIWVGLTRTRTGIDRPFSSLAIDSPLSRPTATFMWLIPWWCHRHRFPRNISTMLLFIKVNINKNINANLIRNFVHK